MMQEIMGDRKQIYEKMSDHLYWLGLLADKQFKYINLSYAVFRWGLAGFTGGVYRRENIAVITDASGQQRGRVAFAGYQYV